MVEPRQQLAPRLTGASAELATLAHSPSLSRADAGVALERCARITADAAYSLSLLSLAEPSSQALVLMRVREAIRVCEDDLSAMAERVGRSPDDVRAATLRRLQRELAAIRADLGPTATARRAAR